MYCVAWRTVTEGLCICSNSSQASVPVASWRRAWSIFSEISSPGSGHQALAVGRNPSRAQDLRALGVDVRQGVVAVAESLWAPMTGVDGVFHIAGWYKIGTGDSREGERVNVLGTRNVLTTMKALRIPRGVYTSTLAVFSDTHGQLVDETYRYDGKGP